MEAFSALLALCVGNSPVRGEFPAQRPETRIFDVFFDLRPNRRLSKQWWGWWFGTLWRPLWCHCNESFGGSSFRVRNKMKFREVYSYTFFSAETVRHISLYINCSAFLARLWYKRPWEMYIYTTVKCDSEMVEYILTCIQQCANA